MLLTNFNLQPRPQRLFIGDVPGASSLDIPLCGWASFSVWRRVLDADSTTRERRWHPCPARRAGVRVWTDDNSIPDAKLFSTMPVDVHFSISNFAIGSGVAVGTGVCQHGRGVVWRRLLRFLLRCAGSYYRRNFASDLLQINTTLLQNQAWMHVLALELRQLSI